MTAILSNAYQGPQSSARPIATGRKSRAAQSGTPFSVVWNTYYNNNMNYGVLLDASIGSAAIDIIKSAYIDNSLNQLPINLFFADTGYTITIPGGAQAWMPIHSMLTQCNISINGMTAAFFGSTNFVTNVILMNVDAVPFTNIQGSVQGSASFTVPGSFDFLVPKFTNLIVTVNGAGGGGNGSPSDNGGNGAQSDFDGTVIGYGGAGGIYAPPGSGADGAASGGDTNTTGGGSRGGPNGNAPGRGGNGGQSVKTYVAQSFAQNSLIAIDVGAGGTSTQYAGTNGSVTMTWN